MAKGRKTAAPPQDDDTNNARSWQRRIIAERDAMHARIGAARVAAAAAYQEGKSADDTIWQLMREVREQTDSLRKRWNIL